MRIKNVNKRLTVTATVIALAFVFCSDVSFAHKFQGTLDFSLGYPQGELNDNIDRTVWGLGLTFGKKLKKSPLILGVDLGVMDYGRDTSYEFLYDNPQFEFKVVHSYYIFQGLVFLRYQPVKHGTLRPYLDALAGMNYMWAETTLSDAGESDGTRIKVNHDDLSLAYGIGGGVMLNLGKKKNENSNPKRTKSFIDLRVRYIFGGRAEYLTEGSIIIENDEVIYLVKESRTDFLTLQFGIGINF